MHKCSKCKQTKPAEEFPKDNSSNSGISSHCKICRASYNSRYRSKRRETTAKWQKENRSHRNKYLKSWYEENPEKIKQYQQKHTPKRRKREKQRRNTDIQFRLSKNLRRRLHHVINGRSKTGSAVRDLGCTLLELKLYLESKFQPGMTWVNYGQWHIDHIKPLSSFDLTDREQFLEVCHYTNLQPLWARDNIQKRDKCV